MTFCSNSCRVFAFPVPQEPNIIKYLRKLFCWNTSFSVTRKFSCCWCWNSLSSNTQRFNSFNRFPINSFLPGEDFAQTIINIFLESESWQPQNAENAINTYRSVLNSQLSATIQLDLLHWQVNLQLSTWGGQFNRNIDFLPWESWQSNIAKMLIILNYLDIRAHKFLFNTSCFTTLANISINNFSLEDFKKYINNFLCVQILTARNCRKF